MALPRSPLPARITGDTVLLDKSSCFTETHPVIIFSGNIPSDDPQSIRLRMSVVLHHRGAKTPCANRKFSQPSTQRLKLKQHIWMCMNRGTTAIDTSFSPGLDAKLEATNTKIYTPRRNEARASGVKRPSRKLFFQSHVQRR